MTNFIFKSANRLVKNSPITYGRLERQLELIQTELRHQRSDHHEMSLKLERLLIDKHLQMQVDEYFTQDQEPDETPHQTDSDDKRDLD